MNVTELARKLRITPMELRDNLPQLGFDIGKKAIKINNNVANRIIREWPILRRRIEQQKSVEEKKDLAAPEIAALKKYAGIISQSLGGQ